MSTITQRIRTISFKVFSARFLIFPQRKTTSSWCTSFPRRLCLRSWGKRGRVCVLSTLTFVVAEAANISPLYTVPLLSIDSILQFSFSTLTFFPFWLLTYTPVSTLSFLALKLRALVVWSVCLLTITLQSLSDWHFSISINFLFKRCLLCYQGLKLNGFTYSHRVQTLQDFFLGYFTCS